MGETKVERVADYPNDNVYVDGEMVLSINVETGEVVHYKRGQVSAVFSEGGE